LLSGALRRPDPRREQDPRPMAIARRSESLHRPARALRSLVRRPREDEEVPAVPFRDVWAAARGFDLLDDGNAELAGDAIRTAYRGVSRLNVGLNGSSCQLASLSQLAGWFY